MRALFVVILLGCSSAEESPAPSTTTDAAVADTATTPDVVVSEDTMSDTMLGMETATETSAPDGWDSFAKSFMTKYCVECHATGSTTRNYTTIDHVKRDQAKIRCGVATTKLSGCGTWPPPKQFPIENATKTNPKPTDAERTRLVAWLDAGAPL
jgi:hypothetical protein